MYKKKRIYIKIYKDIYVYINFVFHVHMSKYMYKKPRSVFVLWFLPDLQSIYNHIYLSI